MAQWAHAASNTNASTPLRRGVVAAMAQPARVSVSQQKMRKTKMTTALRESGAARGARGGQREGEVVVQGESIPSRPGGGQGLGGARQLRGKGRVQSGYKKEREGARCCSTTTQECTRLSLADPKDPERVARNAARPYH